MKAWLLKAGSFVVLAGLLSGCADSYGRPNYAGSGALIGGASGALLGAGLDRRNPGAGALIGGAAGLVTGALIGHSMDDDARRHYVPPPPPPPPVYTTPAPVYAPPSPSATQPTIYDVKSMARSGVGDEVIISQINSTHAVYTLDANSIIDLKSSGVSERVINVMIATSTQVVVQQAPPAPREETIVVAPGPEYSWCGGEWVWNGVEWVWVPGRYVRRPYYGAVWIEARWVRGPRGWYRVSGHWR